MRNSKYFKQNISEKRIKHNKVFKRMERLKMSVIIETY